MHDSVLVWVRDVIARYNPQPPTLEVGSRNVNGSVRPMFSGEYVGVDIVAGPGVDAVVDADDDHYLYASAWCGTIVSTEMLEHDPRPWLTIRKMADALYHNGLLILTCRGFDTGHFGRHDFPGDYWRYSKDALTLLCEDVGCAVLECVDDPEFPGVFLVARRMR